MSIKAINSAIGAQKHQKLNEQKQNNQTSFTGSFNPVVTVMDAIDKGGFAASFIAQDGIGMVAPRIYEGLNRNRQKDENGKKTGPLNWEFARREGIREILSGPSAFLIPMGILTVLKKTSGTANNVHVDHINVLGENFASYASKNPSQLKNTNEFKKGYYSQVFENVLNNSTDKQFDVKAKAEHFANKLVEVESKRAGKDKKAANQLQGELVEEYMKLRKQYAAPSSDEMGVLLKPEGKDKVVGSNIKRLIQSLGDYTGDVLDKTNKYLNKQSGHTVEELASDGSLTKFVDNFNLHRKGTRVLSNFGMWGAVVAFYTLIPKLYNMGLKHDPGLKGLEEETSKQVENKQDKNVAFTGGLTSGIGKQASKDGVLGKVFSKFEFNGASMSVPGMLTLLFGFCLPPRYTNAKSDKERKEILVRDISSFTAILFAAKAMARGFSDAFARISGLALNAKPEDHNKSIFHKIKNYFTAGAGIDVLTSEQIVSKYSNIEDYKNGINGFFNFLEENGGDVKKVLNIDKGVKEQAETIIKDFNGKSLKDATLEEIHAAFEKAKGSEALENIYTVFKSKDNKFINRAKTFNSAFGFASTLVLVPAFMMWLARYCENMTKKAIAKEKEQKALASANEPAPIVQNPKPQAVSAAAKQPTMAGFLNK